MDSRLEVLDDNVQEPMVSGLPEDLQDLHQDLQQETVQYEDGKGAVYGTDDHQNGGNEGMNETSDRDDSEIESEGGSEQDATRNGHVDGMSDQNTVQYGSSDDTGSSKKRKSPNGKLDAMLDISGKKKKTKRASEVSCDSYL